MCSNREFILKILKLYWAHIGVVLIVIIQFIMLLCDLSKDISVFDLTVNPYTQAKMYYVGVLLEACFGYYAFKKEDLGLIVLVPICFALCLFFSYLSISHISDSSLLRAYECTAKYAGNAQHLSDCAKGKLSL